MPVVRTGLPGTTQDDATLLRRLLALLRQQTVTAIRGVFDRLDVNGDASVNNLTVRGLPKGNFASVAGVVPLQGAWPASGNFHVSYPANAVILWSGTSFNTAGGHVNTLNLVIDGVLLDFSPVYVNTANVHTTHPAIGSLTKLSQGSHTAQITLTGTNAGSDLNDYANITVLLFP